MLRDVDIVRPSKPYPPFARKQKKTLQQLDSSNRRRSRRAAAAAAAAREAPAPHGHEEVASDAEVGPEALGVGASSPAPDAMGGGTCFDWHSVRLPGQLVIQLLATA